MQFFNNVLVPIVRSFLKIYFAIRDVKSVYGIDHLDIESLNAYLATWSMTVLSWMP